MLFAASFRSVIRPRENDIWPLPLLSRPSVESDTATLSHHAAASRWHPSARAPRRMKRVNQSCSEVKGYSPKQSVSVQLQSVDLTTNQKLFLWSIYCFGVFFCFFFQTCRDLGITLYDCDSQVKCEVVSCLSSSLLDDSLAPKKVKKIGFPFHTHGGI